MSGAAILVFCGEAAVLLSLCLLSDLVMLWFSLWGCLKTFIPARVAVIGECAVTTYNHLTMYKPGRCDFILLVNLLLTTLHIIHRGSIKEGIHIFALFTDEP